MKVRKSLLVIACAIIFTSYLPAATLYVDVNSAYPNPPYSSWDTAARVIQDAIAAATNGDTILVTNGLYNTGSLNLYGLNRVLISNAVTVRSINGPAVTTIQGYQLPGTTNGTGAIRCAYVTNAAVLSGFTLTGGATALPGGPANGGGVYCQSSGLVVNCVFLGNSAGSGGGGAAGGTCANCLFIGNSAAQGGAANGGWLLNCTVVSNTASSTGGGAYLCELRNSILYYNSAPSYSNCFEMVTHPGTFYCCLTPASSSTGFNFTNEPRFLNPLASDFRLQTNSPCINAGNNAFMTNSLDLAGNPRISGGTVDVGAYELQSPASVLSYVWAQSYGFPIDGSADYADADNDGANNWLECFSGTVPTNAASVLKLWAPVPDASGVSLKWNCVSGRKYHLQRSTNLNAQPAFTIISSNVPGNSGGYTTLRDNQATNTGPYFYRIRVVAPCDAP